MPRLRNALFTLAALAMLVPASASADLFISEYIEGSSFNKAIEIYNPTGAPVEMSEYTLNLYSNGSAVVSQSYNFGLGPLAPGDVLVVSRSDADPAIVAVTDVLAPTVINFNGDDAVELVHGATTIDVIGQIGFDPGSSWSANGVSTANQTLRRKAGVCQGDPNGADPFDPSIEWDSFPQDTFDGLGAHTANCSPTPTNTSTWGRMKSLYR